MQKLIEAGIPVHAFYVANGARKNIESIANATGGKASFLDVNSSQGADLFNGFHQQTTIERH